MCHQSNVQHCPLNDVKAKGSYLIHALLPLHYPYEEKNDDCRNCFDPPCVGNSQYV